MSIDTTPRTGRWNAPVDADAVRLALEPFGASRMLPKQAYLDPEVLAWERRELFGGWVCLGRDERVAEARSSAAFAMGDTGVFVTRSADGTLRAFENACRHRGHELLPCGGSAQSKAIVCPYHAWTYGHDGSLIAVPREDKQAPVDKAQYSLFSMPIVDWHGWLFVDPSRSAGDFVDHIGDLEQIVAPYDGDDLVTAEVHEYDVAANWKTIIENYQECYHCSMIHPELCRVSTPHSGKNLDRVGEWVGGWMELRDNAETMSLDGRSGGVTMARLSEEEQHTVMYVAVLPNLLISLHPDYVMSHLLVPLTPELTRITCSWAFPKSAVERADFDPTYAVDFWDLTNKQDWAACESVARGMRSPSFVAGPLAPDEDGVYRFVTAIARHYLGE
ncbi:MAG: aromatic ring-hydroxylating oxygenase subunit alpha [Nocardioidaceae bacterium]